MSTYNIFQNIVKDENTLSALLCNLLQFRLFRDILLQTINESIMSQKVIFDYEDIRYQKATKAYGTPDITIENEEWLIFIENKISSGTGLTDNQPKGYIEAIKNTDTEGKRILLFFIPENYRFKQDVLQQASTLISNSSKEIYFGFVYWETLINKIRNSGIGELNDVFKHFIDLLELWFSLKKINFTEKELNMLYEGEVISTLTKLMDIVKSLNSKLTTYDKINARMSRSSEEYSLYLKDSLNDTDVLYFGIWYESWRQTKSPLCLAV